MQDFLSTKQHELLSQTKFMGLEVQPIGSYEWSKPERVWTPDYYLQQRWYTVAPDTENMHDQYKFLERKCETLRSKLREDDFRGWLEVRDMMEKIIDRRAAYGRSNQYVLSLKRQLEVHNSTIDRMRGHKLRKRRQGEGVYKEKRRYTKKPRVQELQGPWSTEWPEQNTNTKNLFW